MTYREAAGTDVWATVVRPTLVVDKAKVTNNIRRMMQKAGNSGVRFRPHFKTHTSLAIGAWFRELGVTTITVSSVEMARLFASDGWQDITIAFPLNIRALAEIEQLAESVRLGLLVDSIDSAVALASVRAACDVWIDVDVGYGRTGIPWNDRPAFVRVLRALSRSRHHSVRGVLTHAGHAYLARSLAAIEEIHHQSVERMNAVRASLLAVSGSDLEVSVGDTPTCSVVLRFNGVDEVRPGNFVFYDLQQLALGVCTVSDLALAVACPVVGVYPSRKQAVVQGGSIHLSRDSVQDRNGVPVYGRLAFLTEQAWDLLPEDCAITSLSQEHGVISAPAQVVNQVRIGDLALIIPAHACMAANLVREGVVLAGGSRSQALPHTHS